MAIIKITNGIETIEVQEGAFEVMFKPVGFYIVEEKVEEEDVDEEIDEDESYADALLEKPISEWNKTEVKKFSAIKGIDLSGTKNAAEAKDVIKEFLDAE